MERIEKLKRFCNVAKTVFGKKLVLIRAWEEDEMERWVAYTNDADETPSAANVPKTFVYCAFEKDEAFLVREKHCGFSPETLLFLLKTASKDAKLEITDGKNTRMSASMDGFFTEHFVDLEGSDSYFEMWRVLEVARADKQYAFSLDAPLLLEFMATEKDNRAFLCQAAVEDGKVVATNSVSLYMQSVDVPQLKGAEKVAMSLDFVRGAKALKVKDIFACMVREKYAFEAFADDISVVCTDCMYGSFPNWRRIMPDSSFCSAKIDKEAVEKALKEAHGIVGKSEDMRIVISVKSHKASVLVEKDEASKTIAKDIMFDLPCDAVFKFRGAVIKSELDYLKTQDDVCFMCKGITPSTSVVSFKGDNSQTLFMPSWS